MFGKLSAAWKVFKQGEAVANPAAWKKGQITATMLGGLFIAVVQFAKTLGYEVPLDTETATAIAGGVVALVNWLLTLSTSKTVGIGKSDDVSRFDEATVERAREFVEDHYKG